MAIDLNKIYNELLGRPPDTAGKNYWQNQFDTGSMTGKQIRESIKQSPEYLQPKASDPNKLTVTGINPTFNPATITAVGGGGGGTSNIITTGQQAAPSWNVATKSIADPYASDPNYTTTAPTGMGPHFPINIGGKTYYKTGGNQTLKAELHPVYSGYQGAAETGYTQTVPAYTGAYDKGSKNQRADENIYHHNILDELTKYAQQSGIGSFAVSDASKPQWTPTGDRNEDNRVIEDLWQQGQISDLESWAQSVIDSGTYGDLTFKPSDVYHGYGRDGTTYSTHRNEGMRRNESQFSGINNLVDFISQLDTARAPEIAANKEQLSSIYGGEIDRLYNELFDTDTGIDQAGKDYWTKDLIENRPGLAKGQDWQDWLGKAFRNTHSFKDYEVSKGPDVLPIEGAPDNDSGTLPSVAPTFQQDLDVEKGNWGIGNYDSVQSDPWADAMQEFTSSYTSQINDLKKAFQESTRSNEKMLKSYQDQVAGYQKDLQAQAAYGERPMNQTVKAVKTRNELPGYKPKTGGSTGHFSRTGSRLSTQSLNVA